MAGASDKGRVVVAMSGGVDSSVTAALLVAEGFEVVGVTLQLYDHGRAVERKNACCAGRDVADARAVADRLGIPHYVLDFEARFKEAVIDDFAAAYAAGQTPVPCVRCNQKIKFRDLLGIARDLGAEALATGHYARRIDGPGGPELHAAVDPARDQSYFLFATTRDQLAFLRLPLGDRPKAATRRFAADLGLPVAAKPDSQDICFVPDGRHADLVKRLRPEAAEPGPVVDPDGRVLGRHDGIAGFTVGQRRGLGVASGERRYVLAIDPKRRAVVVGGRAAGAAASAVLREVNWLGPAPPPGGLPVLFRHRARVPAIAGALDSDESGGARVTFAEPAVGVAPGQAGVAYAGTRLLGGGWIERTELSRTA